MPHITVIAKLKAKPGMEARVEKELEKMVEETQKEPGCINYDLHRHLDDKGTFLFHENWETKDALDNHMQTPHFLNLTSIVDEILEEPPEIGLFEKIRCSEPVRN